MATAYSYHGRGQTRAADADRDRVAGLLNTAFVEGRLTREEYDARLGRALTARNYAELDHIVADLPLVPVPQYPLVGPLPPTNGLAIASLALGVGQLVFGPLATIPAIVCGHVARSQIRRTGERGSGLALAGLLLGWGAVALAVLAAVLLVAVVSTGHAGQFGPGGPMPHPPPMLQHLPQGT